MSQQNVYQLLKRKKRWMTSKEISKILDLQSANASLGKLYKYREIMRRRGKIDEGNKRSVYEYKIK